MRLYDVIQNESHLVNAGAGSKSTIAWKFLGEDFNDNAQLIVAESEEAVFVRDGVAVAVFTGGRYTLNSNNHPFIAAIRRRLSGGANPFTCKVYFVNKDHKLELFWGTDSPIQMRDPVLRLQTSIQARGAYSLQVADSKKFLLKMIGNNIQMFTQEEVNGYFRSAFLQHIKDAIARYIKDSGEEILEVCTEKTRIAEGLYPVLAPVLEEYGLTLINFHLAAIDIPESDPNRGKLEEAFADKGVMGVLGEDWARQQSASILRDLANNPGSGGVASAGAATGLGFAAGSAFGDMASNMFAPGMQQSGPSTTEPGRARRSRFEEAEPAPANDACASCDALVATDAQFCGQCGVPVAPRSCGACQVPLTPGSRFCSACGVQTDKGA